ncbi:polymorphic toxin type 44 domain-containing protein, partial [Pseudomonas sp. OV226]|uniref:polymorphic toxin type 44 domain-containing protein n=1 Tax=Pseudomonas sp. OV226 TaxID=2135588 RepID=UPI000D79677F
MEELAAYIASEMNTNIHHPSVLKMKELLSYDVAEETRKQMALPWYAQIGTTSPQAIAASNGTAAMALFTERVGQDRPWDHKPTLLKLFGGKPRHKQGAYDYFYDIWSNIHYGYVGRAGGLSESVLSDGAGAEQIVSDSERKLRELVGLNSGKKPLPGPHRSADVDGLRAWDDAPDRISISIGIKLYNQHPNGGITAKMVMDEVLAVSPEEWGDGASEHKCETN